MIPETITVTVEPDFYIGDRFAATVSYDGRVTTRTCTHLHHTAAAAAKCIAKVAADEDQWAGIEAVVVDKAWRDPGDADIYEQATEVEIPAGFGAPARMGKVTRRFLFVDEAR